MYAGKEADLVEMSLRGQSSEKAIQLPRFKRDSVARARNDASGFSWSSAGENISQPCRSP